MLKITLKKSLIGRVPKHKKTIEALGLKRIGQTVEKEDNPAIRGMLSQIDYLVEVEEA